MTENTSDGDPRCRLLLPKALALSAGLVALLLSCAVVGIWNREFLGYYYGVRLAMAGAGSEWHSELMKLGEAGAPGCRLAYRVAGNREAKRAAAEILASCRGEATLAAFVEEVGGPGTPAEEALVGVIAFNHIADRALAPEGAIVMENEYRIPSDSLKVVRPLSERVLWYAIGKYEVQVFAKWRRSVSGRGGGGMKSEEKLGPWDETGTEVRVSRRGDAARPRLIDKMTFECPLLETAGSGAVLERVGK